VDLATADVASVEAFNMSAVAFGDANADGCSDIALGEVHETFWVAGPPPSPMALETGDDWTAMLVDIDFEDYSGGAVAVGDFDGDGFDDLAVGALYGGPTDEGAAYIVYSPVVGEHSLAEADATLLGAGKSTPYEMSAGDIDGDGLDDLALTYRPHYSSPDQEGKVYMVYGPMEGTAELSQASSVVVDDSMDESQSSFGMTMSIRGDFDADGLSDLVVSAKLRQTWDNGVVYVHMAPFVGPEFVSDADATFVGPNGSWAGTAMSAGGDVDGDGHDDLLIGTSVESAGRAYLLRGPLDGDYTAASVDGTVYLLESLSYFGCALTIEQDLDGNGQEDIVIGSAHSSLYTPVPSTVFVFYDPPEGTIEAGDADAFIHSPSGGDYGLMEGMGSIVEPVGDTNGDGFDDILVGSGMNSSYYILFGGPL